MSEFSTNTPWKKVRPANVYDVAANETWLEDMAQKGYFLTEMTGWQGTFEEGDPRQCRYRMSPMAKKEAAPPPEMMEAYEELGWQYVTSLKGTFHIWRCDDTAVPELDTDPVVQAEGYRHLKRRMLRSAMQTLALVAVLVGGMYAWTGSVRVPLLVTLRQDVPGEYLVNKVLLLCLLVLLVMEARDMRRLLRTLQAGIPLERPKRYSGQRWFTRICLAALVLSVLMPLLHMKTMTGRSLWEGKRLEWETLPADAVYPDLTRLDGLAQEEIFLSDAAVKRHELASAVYTLRQHVDPARSADSECFHMRTESLAKRAERELREEYEDKQDDCPLEAVSVSGMDAFWWRQDAKGRQYAVCRKGKTVVGVLYRGTADLRTALGSAMAGWN